MHAHSVIITYIPYVCIYVNMYIYIYMVPPPPGTYLFDEFTGICSVFYPFLGFGESNEKEAFPRTFWKDVLEASGLIETDLNRFNLNRAWIQESLEKFGLDS